jgi:hypothetical protein
MLWKFTRWVDPWWWQYLLDNHDYRHPNLIWPGWTKFRCRIKGHPGGVWFFNAGGTEPDMTCKNCGDDLG